MQPSREYMALATTLLDALGDEKDGEHFQRIFQRIRSWLANSLSIRYRPLTTPSPLWADVDFCSTSRR